MNDIFAEMEKAAVEDVALPTDEKIAALGTLVQELRDKQQLVVTLEAQLKAEKKELGHLETGKIPDAMIELNLKTWASQDGWEVTCKPFVDAAIKNDNKPLAYKWLRDNGHGDLIKHVITVNVGTDQALADDVKTSLEEKGILAEDKEAIHHMQLKAFAREQVEAGSNIPMDLFGIYLGNKASIKGK